MRSIVQRLLVKLQLLQNFAQTVERLQAHVTLERAMGMDIWCRSLKMLTISF